MRGRWYDTMENTETNGRRVARRKVQILIRSHRFELMPGGPAPEEDELQEEPAEAGRELVAEISTPGRLTYLGGRTELSWEETAESGMGGSRTALSFADVCPEQLVMTRSGAVCTTMYFATRERSRCTYRTKEMTLELGVYAHVVRNRLEEDGTIYLDYQLEMQGVRMERLQLEIAIR